MGKRRAKANDTRTAGRHSPTVTVVDAERRAAEGDRALQQALKHGLCHLWNGCMRKAGAGQCAVSGTPTPLLLTGSNAPPSTHLGLDGRAAKGHGDLCGLARHKIGRRRWKE